MKSLLNKLKNVKDKKALALSLVAAITLLIVMVGATYAYFKAQGGGTSNSPLNVTTNTTDNLSFMIDKDIEINANMDNFSQEDGNVTDSATASATLVTNNKTNHAKAKYNIYFVIEKNELIYTTDDAKPELLLKVTDPNNNVVEYITGLNYTGDGFDITTRTGGFLIASDYDIETTSSFTQNWKIEVTLVNLDSDQNKNGGKEVNAKIFVTKEKLSSYEPVEINGLNKDEASSSYNSLTATLNVTNGTTEIDKYYFGIEETPNPIALNKSNTTAKRLSTLASKDTVTYYESDTPSYTFTNLKSNTSYTIYSYAIDKLGFKSNVYETVLKTDEYNNAVVNSITTSSTLNSISITNVDVTKGSTDIVEYCYSKDDGVSYDCTTNNTHTFSGLNDTTEYKIKVKVKDQEEKYSTEYYQAVSTVTYNIPTVTNVTFTKTYNSITLTPVGSNGTNNISKYQYSINGGTYQDSNSFAGLNESTEYTIKVKAIDTLGRESLEYELKVTTDTYLVPTINKVESSSTYNSISLTVTASNGNGTIEEYCYSKDNGSNYDCASSNTYTFSDLTSDVQFTIKVKVKDNNNRYSSEYTTLVKTKPGTLLANRIMYTEDGVNGLYKHDGIGTYGEYEAGDGSYRFAGANPNNYVCFGSTATTCPTDNLYRIIGIFDGRIKLIKYDYGTTTQLGTNGEYGSSVSSNSSYYKGKLSTIPYYYWNNSTNKNTWSESNLNKVNLNTNYWNNLGTTWQAYIDDTDWKVGGNTSEKISTTAGVKNVYTAEIVTPAESTTYRAKIGLMYVSDYMYASNPSSNNAWSALMGNNSNESNDFRAVHTDNWMSMGAYDWTITRFSETSGNAFYVEHLGTVYNSYVYKRNFIGVTWESIYKCGIRPTFYLKSTVEFSSGSGTESDPYRIA